MKNKTLETVKESLGLAQDILLARREEEAKAVAAQREIEDDLKKLNEQRTLAAELDNENVYANVCKQIQAKEEKLKYAEIRAKALRYAKDEARGNEEYQKLQDVFHAYESETLADLLKAVETYNEKASALLEVRQFATIASALWKKVAGADELNFALYNLNCFSIPERAISADMLTRLRERVNEAEK